jgi:Zn-dependent oligopeptidase
VSFTLEELKGVPEDVVSGYTQREEGGKTVYDITFKTPDIFPLVRFTGSCGYQRLIPELSILKFKFAENPGTRQQAYDRYENRLAINAPLLDKVLGLRRQIAKLLGYNTWADYITEVKMVKNAASVQTVRVFLKTADASADIQFPT